MKAYALIPARSGSKGVPKKNIKVLNGYPLMAYSIMVAKLSLKIERVIVSTDSQEIADVALRFGAEVPFLRPSEFAQDNSTDLSWIRHALEWFEKEEELPDFFVHLRPTTPLRIPGEIDEAVICLEKRPDATSLRSVHELPEPVQKMVQFDENNFLQGFFPDDPRPEYYNLPRQTFPEAYHPDGYVDVIKPHHIQKTQTLFGPRCLGFKGSFKGEVDTQKDFEYLEYILDKEGHPLYDHLAKNFPKE